MIKTEIAKKLLRRVFIKELMGAGRCEYYEIDGKMDGEYISWYRNGQLAYRCYFENGRLEGKYEHWEEGGQLLEHYYYNNGVKI